MTITDKNGTTTATISDGAKGEQGKDGKSIVNAYVGGRYKDTLYIVIETEENGETVSKTIAAGIVKGDKGDAYTLTAADKTEIAAEAAGMVDVPTNVSAFTNDAGYLTEHQDISGKADASNVYSKARTDAKLNNKVNNSDFIQYKSTVYTAAEIDRKNFLTTHQSLAAYYTSAQVDAAIQTAIGDVENGSY